MFYGGEENQGGSPNRGEGVPFNETVQLNRTAVSAALSASRNRSVPAAITSQGLTSGFPLNTFTLPAPVSFRGVQSSFRNPLVQNGTSWSSANCRGRCPSRSIRRQSQAHQVILWNSDRPPISARPLPQSQPRRSVYPAAAGCPLCASIGNGLSMTSSFGYGQLRRAVLEAGEEVFRGLQFLTAYTWSHAMANSARR